MGLFVFQTRLYGSYERTYVAHFGFGHLFVFVYVGRLWRDMGAWGGPFLCVDRVGDTRCEQGLDVLTTASLHRTCNPTKNAMHATHAFDTAHHVCECGWGVRCGQECWSELGLGTYVRRWMGVWGVFV